MGYTSACTTNRPITKILASDGGAG